MKRILFIDVESTGVDYADNEIVEVACLFYEDGVMKSSFCKKINPSFNKEINLGALKINKHKLTSQYFNREEAAKQLADYLVSLPSSKESPISIGGHNVAFDIQGIKEFLKEFNIVGLNELFSYSVVDTSTIGNFLRYCTSLNMARMSLSKLAETLQIEVDETKTHSAMYDAELSAKCFFKMCELVQRSTRI
jgi:DNA polymerase III alpha subunit (gram-positive type)